MAFGDNTVPNITIGNIIRAGQLFDVFTYDRNDRTVTNGTNPHGLPDPTRQGRQQGEALLTTSLKTSIRVDFDGPGDIVKTPTDDRLNLQCLHSPNPQTGLVGGTRPVRPRRGSAEPSCAEGRLSGNCRGC